MAKKEKKRINGVSAIEKKANNRSANDVSSSAYQPISWRKYESGENENGQWLINVECRWHRNGVRSAWRHRGNG
jgi:hypothetical protein